MKLLLLNAVCGVGSTGRILIDLLDQAKEEGHVVRIACSTVEPIKGVDPREVFIVGSKLDYYFHNICSRCFDHEGLYSKITTKRLINQIREFDPDIVHLHNIHGHWINYELLFQYLTKEKKKVIWTLHDCWPFTGHCTHFSLLGCEQWKKGCRSCSGLDIYPKTYGKGDVLRNYDRKRKAFTSVNDMVIVTPSQWLADLVRASFLNIYPIQVIHNKIDLSVFQPRVSSFREKYHIENKRIILGVANVWSKEKGYEDFLKLADLLDDSHKIVLVGLTKEQLETLPPRILGIQRTNNAIELAELYSTADVFVNLTYQDNFPTVNLEAIACGTPVISYITGGSCESFDGESGIAVAQGSVQGVANAIRQAAMMKRDRVLLRRNDFAKYGNYKELYRQQV